MADEPVDYRSLGEDELLDVIAEKARTGATSRRVAAFKAEAEWSRRLSDRLAKAVGAVEGEVADLQAGIGSLHSEIERFRTSMGESSTRLEHLTWAMVGFTVVIAALTGFLVWERIFG